MKMLIGSSVMAIALAMPEANACCSIGDIVKAAEPFVNPVAGAEEARKRAEEARRAAEKAAEEARKAAAKLDEETRRAAAKADEEARKVAAKAEEEARNAAARTEEETRRVAAQAAENARKAADDTEATLHKAVADTGATTEKALRDLADAVKASIRYTQRQVDGYGETLSDAEVRLREGKVVDAIWHAALQPIQNTEENAAKATQESEVIRVAGQIAASAYGGPGGAAAYAAWQTYRLTGDVELALKVGIITGLSSSALGSVNELPSETAAQLAQKTVLAGAVGGLAVAAAGGDEEAIKEGFLRSGGMVLVQDGYERVTTHEFDARSSKGPAYCMATVGAECSPEFGAYETDAQGNILLDEDGLPKVDVKKTDPMRPHVGKWAKEGTPPVIGATEDSGLMVAVSKYPGMNAMAVFHDEWSVSWNMNAFVEPVTIVPAVVLTYIGTGGPYYDTLQKTAVEVEELRKKDREAANALGVELDAKAKTISPSLNWRGSIVDSLKLLGASHDDASRKALATYMNYPGDVSDIGKVDAWLYPRLLVRLGRDGSASIHDLEKAAAIPAKTEVQPNAVP